MPIHVPQATRKGYIEVRPVGVFDYAYPNSKLRRGRVQGGGKVCPALTANQGELYVYEGVYEEDTRLLPKQP